MPSCSRGLSHRNDICTGPTAGLAGQFQARSCLRVGAAPLWPKWVPEAVPSFTGHPTPPRSHQGHLWCVVTTNSGARQVAGQPLWMCLLAGRTPCQLLPASSSPATLCYRPLSEKLQSGVRPTPGRCLQALVTPAGTNQQSSNSHSIAPSAFFCGASCVSADSGVTSSEVPVIPSLAKRCPSKLAPVSSGHVPTDLRVFPEPHTACSTASPPPAQPL